MISLPQKQQSVKMKRPPHSLKGPRPSPLKINKESVKIEKPPPHSLQGPRPSPLKINKESVKIEKPPPHSRHSQRLPLPLLQGQSKRLRGQSNSSSSRPKYLHDVFLSCSWEDTRKGFTDHLYWTLKDHGVNVFMDENEITPLEMLSDQVNMAIERSRICVIVFSKSYVGSRWRELVKIMECKGQSVMPIFYDIDPADVRVQTDEYDAHHRPLRELFLNNLLLYGNNNILQTTADGHEGVFIRKYIDRITKILDCIKLSLPIPQFGIESPLQELNVTVGIDSRVQEISNYLGVGRSNDVRIIGIWAMGGMGKTTVAKAIFNKYYHNFDGQSFLQNVRERKLVDLQKQLLYDILKPANTEVSSVIEGTKDIEKRLWNIKVLVVIDDIDHVEQLDALAVNRDTFGLGSRIIITTRDEHLLKILKVDKICSLQAMNDEEALELFGWHAFGNRCPTVEYQELSRQVVDYCGGLPLALEILGRNVRTKSTIFWETTLRELKRQPHREIHEKLKVSYDGLTDDDVKAIFLDISCFFVGMNKEYVMTILDGCDLYSEIGIEELQERCLVTVDKEGNLMMPNLVRDMGREIVRAESPDNPGKRSRLWDNEDVRGVLSNKSGTEEIEGLTLDLQETDNLSFSTKVFEKMQGLRLLKLNYVHLPGRYKYLPKDLRWLCWHGFPLEVIPEDFDQENIVVADLSYSKLKQVWKGSDVLLEKLKFLNLSHSYNLAQSPDFSKLPNLEKLVLEGCESVREVDSSIGDLERLALVNLEDCKSLKDLPQNFYNSKSIETLLLNGCSRFENLAEGLGNMASLTTLQANNTVIRQVPSSIVRLKNLRSLSLCGVRESPSTNLWPPSLHGLNSLRELALAGCNLTDDAMPRDLGSLFSLEDLDLGNNFFRSLPSLSGLSKLEMLCLNYCTNLSAIPDLPTNLKVLRAVCCTVLDTMPDFSEMSNIKELYLSDSFKLTEVPGLDKSLNSMTRIHMEGCTNLTTAFRTSILQGWTSCGYGGIFLSGDYFPEWFKFVNDSNEVYFEVPQVIGGNLKGLTLCCVYSSKKQPEGPLGVTVTNKTKQSALFAGITYATVPTACEREEHYLWQGKLSNDVVNLQGGDQVEIVLGTVTPGDDSVKVKKTGVNLVWDDFMNIPNVG